MVLQNFNNVLRISQEYSRLISIRTTATNAALKPVKLAYSTYETTTQTKADEKPPLVILHGLFGSKSNWNSLCKVYHQKTNRKIVAVDQRNHGDSPHNKIHTYEHCALDLKFLLEQLQIPRCSLLGHSMGGRTVMLFALKYPELVERLIVADISPFTSSPHMNTLPGYFTAMRSVNLPKNIPMSQARKEADEQLLKFVRDKGLRSFLLSNLVQSDTGGFKWRINIPALENNFGDIARFPKIENSKFQGPTLFLGGGASDFIPKKDAERLGLLFPNFELKYIDGAGHWLHSEKPQEFIQISTEFLNKTT